MKLYSKYRNDRINAYTSAERAEAKILRIEAKEELNKARRKLAAYKMIYQNIKSNQTTTIEGITEMYETLTEDNFEAISDSAINQFRGWEVGKGSLTDVVKRFNSSDGRGTQYT